MSLTLRARLTAVSIVTFGLLIGAISVVSYQVLARQLDAGVTTRLSELAEGLHGYLRIENGAASVVFDETDNDQAAFVHEATRYFQAYDGSTGRLLVASGGVSPLSLRFTPGEVRAFLAQPRTFDIETEYGRLRVSNSKGGTAGHGEYLLQVGVPLAPMDTALSRYRDLLLLGVPPALLAAIALSWWLSGFALLPLTRIASAAHDIDLTTLNQRLPGRGVGDELDEVVDSFNGTLSRLEHSVGEMRQFSAAMAHELRTPLAALRGEIELSSRLPETSVELRERMASQLEEVDRLTRLIDQILTLARAESGQIRLAKGPVDLTDLVSALVDQIEPIADARSIELRCEVAEALVVSGDAGWLRRLILNLVDNALKYTSEHGRVVVTATSRGDRVELAVADTGIGLSAAERDQVFERFFRADPARSSDVPGAGLGLSLVQWIAAQHGGSARVESQPGVGSTFTVSLPMARPATK